MSTNLTIYTPPPPADAEVVSDTQEEICLKLTQQADRVLLEIVDPKTGRHVEAGNLINIYPDGTYSIIPGVKWGNRVERGLKEKYPS